MATTGPTTETRSGQGHFQDTSATAPSTPAPTPVPDGTPAPAGAPPDASSLAYQQAQLANALKGLVPDKQGNLVDPATGQIKMSFGQLSTAVWTGALSPSQVPEGAAVSNAHAPGSLIPTGNGTYTTTLGDGKQYIIAADGSYFHSDGTPAIDPATGKQGKDPGVSTIIANDTNKPINDPLGNVITDTLNTVQDSITKGNPIAGTIRAGVDLVTGNKDKVLGDLTNGTTFGGVSVDSNGNITPGTTTHDVSTTAGDAGLTPPKLGLGDLVSGLTSGLGTGNGIDISKSDAETTRANALADALGGQANAAGAQADTDRALGTQTRGQQEQSIQDLQDAAAGKVPSAAELALTRQSGIDAARQQGLAAALQGSNPGAALRQASMGAAKVAGDTAATAAGLRATEQANARNALATTLGNVRSADQGNVNTDVGQQTNLNNAGVTSQGQGVTSTGQGLTAKTEEDKARAGLVGAGAGAAGTLLAGILSDKRAKKNIAKASLADALGKGVHGVTFSYRPESGEDDTPHFGLLAQELEKVIPGVVKKRGGMRTVDTGHLTMANSAMLAELADRLMALEKKGARRNGG